MPILFRLQKLRGVPRGASPFRPARGVPVNQSINITGITRDSAGAALGGCVVQLFSTPDDRIVSEVTSDGAGNYSFRVGNGSEYYVVAYNAGSPDVAGTTVNTLAGV